MKKILLALLIFGILGKHIGASENVKGCYIRDYDNAHLARHPNQLVTNVRLLIKDARGDSNNPYHFFLQVRMRGSSKALITAGFCEWKGPGLHCMVECDGGGINVSPRSAYVMMYLDRIRMATCESDKGNIEDGKEISGGIDDREFRVHRVDDSMCHNMKLH